MKKSTKNTLIVMLLSVGQLLYGVNCDDESSHLVMAESMDDQLDLVAEESGNAASTVYPDQEPRYTYYTT